MNKIQINEEKYSELVNEKMSEHPEFKDGMKVELTPESTSKPSGLHIIGANGVRGVVAWAEARVKEEYNIVPTR